MSKYKKASERKTPKRKIELRNAKEVEAILLFMEAGLMPQDPFKGANYKWKSICWKCGELVSPRFADIKGGRGGCKPCAMKSRQTPEFLDEIMKIMKNANLEPLEPYKSSNHKWKCKCLQCGEIVRPQASNIRNGHGGCVFCSVAAFKHGEPAYLYLIHHQGLGSYKVGIGNYRIVNDRIKSHIKAGWKLLKKYPFEQGKTAMRVEKKFLKWIRDDLKLPVYLAKKDFKHGGHSETFADDSITLLEMDEKVREIIRGYRK